MRTMMMMALTICLALRASAQDSETIRSYCCQQISGPSTMYGPNQRVPENMATYVEWYSDNTIRMMDGTIWKYKGCQNGFFYFGYVRSTGMSMPGVQYIEAIFNANFSQMQVNYLFGIGLPGSAILMNSLYAFIGEGRRPASDWMNGNY